MRRACALIGAAALLLSGCEPRPDVEIRVMPEPTAAVERAVSESDRAGEAFVLNPASQRFHRPGCAWAEKIAEDRRIDWTGDREDLLAVGYQPCHFCDP